MRGGRSGGVLLDLPALTRLGVDALAGQPSSSSLVSAAARARVLRADVTTATAGVGAVFSYGALELRLDGDDRVDVLGCVTVDDGGFDALAKTKKEPPPALAPAIAHWRRAPRSIEALWVEVDVDDDGAVPFAFFRFAPNAATEDVVAAAQALSASTQALAALTAFSSSLAPSDQLLHVAWVGGRGGDVDGVRVHLGVASDRVGAVVNGVVDADVAAEAVDVAGAWPAGSLLGVQLDLAARPSPFVDLELFFPSSPVDDARWRAPLTRIAQRAAVDANQLALLERWPTRRGEPPSSSWPLELQRTLQVKLRLTRAGAKAKGYLGFSPRMAV